MRKRRIFAPSANWFEDYIILDKPQCHHIKDVLRLKTGSCLICFDETGRMCEVSINDIQNDSISLRILKMKSGLNNTAKKISIAQSIVKANCMDSIIRKSVELGVVEIIPFISEYSVIKLDEKRKESKIGRWAKIAVEAVKQSGSPQIPVIKDIINFVGFLELSSEYDIIFVAHPYSDKFDMNSKIEKAKKVLLVIGPEGGFSESEIKQLDELPNSFFWCFNENILRAETAAVSGLSILSYEMNK